MDNTAKLGLWNAYNISNVFEWDTATERYASQHLKLAQPLHASQELVLEI